MWIKLEKIHGIGRWYKSISSSCDYVVAIGVYGFLWVNDSAYVYFEGHQNKRNCLHRRFLDNLE